MTWNLPSANKKALSEATGSLRIRPPWERLGRMDVMTWAARCWTHLIPTGGPNISSLCMLLVQTMLQVHSPVHWRSNNLGFLQVLKTSTRRTWAIPLVRDAWCTLGVHPNIRLAVTSDHFGIVLAMGVRWERLLLLEIAWVASMPTVRFKTKLLVNPTVQTSTNTMVLTWNTAFMVQTTSLLASTRSNPHSRVAEAVWGSCYQPVVTIRLLRNLDSWLRKKIRRGSSSQLEIKMGGKNPELIQTLKNGKSTALV